MQGKALIDLPAHGLRCGEYGDLPDADAERLSRSGEYDLRAAAGEQPQPAEKPKRPRTQRTASPQQ